MQASTKVPHLDSFPLSRDERIKTLLTYIVSVIDQPMTPIEFVQKWVNHPLIEKNYSKACDQALVQATGLRLYEISNWGKRYSKHPTYIGYVLRLADIIRQAQAVGICKGRSQNYWESKKIALPDTYSVPKYQFNDRVSTGSDFGSVVGFAYLNNEWHYLIQLHPDSPQAQEQPTVQLPQQKLSWW